MAGNERPLTWLVANDVHKSVVHLEPHEIIQVELSLNKTVELKKQQSNTYSRENLSEDEVIKQVRFIDETYKIGEENLNLLSMMAESDSSFRQFQFLEQMGNKEYAVVGVAALRKRDHKYDFMYVVESMPFNLRQHQHLNDYEVKCLQKYFKVETVKRLQRMYPLSMIESP